MRILHIITKLNEMYGAQRHVIESLKDHLKRGHICMVLTGEVGVASETLSGLVEVKELKHLKNSYSILKNLHAVVETIKIIEDFKPDLVISHSTIAGIVARIACYKKKVPNIFTVQGWPFEIGAQLHQRLAGIIIERALKPFSDSYLCVSKYTAEYGVRKVKLKNVERIFVCPNMHVKKSFKFNSPFKTFRNVLMVAGFRAQKDHLTALKALKKLVDGSMIYGIHFTFVGDGPRRGELERFIQDNHLEKYITLAGEVTNIDSYYESCDIVILPTFYEGLPISIIEAIQKGKPVIASDVAGIKEMVHTNVNGQLIAVSDYSALACHIAEFYNGDQLQGLSIRSRRIYEEFYHYDKVSEKLNMIMSSAVEKSVFRNPGHKESVR